MELTTDRKTNGEDEVSLSKNKKGQFKNSEKKMVSKKDLKIM